jgi:hypothetical protein
MRPAGSLSDFYPRNLSTQLLHCICSAGVLPRRRPVSQLRKASFRQSVPAALSSVGFDQTKLHGSNSHVASQVGAIAAMPTTTITPIAEHTIFQTIASPRRRILTPYTHLTQPKSAGQHVPPSRLRRQAKFAPCSIVPSDPLTHLQNLSAHSPRPGLEPGQSPLKMRVEAHASDPFRED